MGCCSGNRTMASTSFSHQKIPLSSPQPGTKLGESDDTAGVRLEAKDTKSLLLSPHRAATPKNFDGKCRFLNGWFCKKCGRVTEHEKVEGREVCLECGYKMGLDRAADVKARKKAYSQRADVKAKQKKKQRLRRIEKLEAKLQALKTEERREALLYKA